MNYRKFILLVGFFISFGVAQAGWWSDTKKWVTEKTKQVSKEVENLFTGNKKKNVQSEPQKPAVAPKPKKVGPAVAPKPKKVGPAVAPKPKKVGPAVAPKPKKVGPAVAPKPVNSQQTAMAQSLGKNVKILQRLTDLYKDSQQLLSEHPELDGMMSVYIGQMLDGFKNTNGVPVGEEEIAMQVVNNIETVFDDYKTQRLSAEDVSDFIDKTFELWKEAYWTEEMFGQGDDDYYLDEDDYFDEDWDDDMEEPVSVVPNFGNNATEEQKEAAVTAVRGGLLEQIKAGKGLKSAKQSAKQKEAPSGGSNSLLGQIKAGKKLKSVSDTELQNVVQKSSERANPLMNALKSKLEGINNAAGYREEDNDDDFEDQDWSDDDFDD